MLEKMRFPANYRVLAAPGFRSVNFWFRPLSCWKPCRRIGLGARRTNWTRPCWSSSPWGTPHPRWGSACAAIRTLALGCPLPHTWNLSNCQRLSWSSSLCQHLGFVVDLVYIAIYVEQKKRFSSNSIIGWQLASACKRMLAWVWSEPYEKCELNIF